MKNMAAKAFGRAINVDDWPVILAFVTIGLAGALAIYNATFHTGQPFHFAGRQIIWLTLAVLVLMACAHVPADSYRRWIIPISVPAVLCLYWVALRGTVVNGMSGWFSLESAPFGRIFIQPSELMKPLYVLFFARILARDDASQADAPAYVRYLLLASLWIIPLILQPDFGTCLLYILGFALLYWLRGGRVAHLLATITLFSPFLFVALTRYPYLKNRLRGFMDPLNHLQDAGWHIVQLRATFASGGLWGHRLGDSLWSRHYLPLSHSDSMFASIAETIGFAGCAAFVAAIIAVLVVCMHTARRQQCLFRLLATAGLAAMIAIQSFVHISVAIGLLPPTGLTLPMFSYGGSSLMATSMSVGIILSLARDNDSVRC